MKIILMGHFYNCSKKITLSETLLTTSLKKLISWSKWSKTSKTSAENTDVCIPYIRIKLTQI